MPNRRVPDDVAQQRLDDAGFTAMEPYPGSNKAWRIRCAKCGNESRKTLYQAEHHACKWCTHGLVSEQAANELAKQNRLKPLEPYLNASHASRMLCLDCGRESRTRLYRLRESRGCIYCKSKRKVDPEIAAEAARAIGLEPLEEYGGSRKPWRVLCVQCETEWDKTWNAIRDGHGCARCSQRFVLPDDADEDFVSRGFIPRDEYVNARTHRTCNCRACGFEVLITREQVLSGRQCPFCSGNATHPVTAREVMKGAGLEPLEEFDSVDRPWLARCVKCSKTVAPAFRTVRNGGGCIYCAKRRVDDEDANLVMARAGLEPLEPYPGANAPWSCKCSKCQRVVSPTMTRVRSGEARGCAYCSNRRVHPDDAVAIMEAAGFTPLDAYPGVHRGWRARCKNCDRESAPNFSRVQAGSACRWCRPYGIDLTQPATLYVIAHSELGAYKVGIAQETSPRIAVHQRYGWDVLGTWAFPTGLLARSVEQSVLDHFRSVLDLPPYLSSEVMPQGGWTETISSEAMSERGLLELVKRFARNHE